MSYEAELIAQGLCPEVIAIDTEDGPGTGRCRGPIVTVTIPPDSRYGETAPYTAAFACEGHSQEILGWRAMTELERCEWERRHAEENDR